MKTNYIMTAAAACAFLFSGCYDLDRFPEDKLSSGTFWKTQEHADQGMMGVYSVLQNNDVTGMYFFLDDLTEIGYGRSAVGYSDIAQGTTNARTNTYKNRWSNLYEGITRSNTALQNIPNVEMEDGLKNRYIGEAKFLRAFFYFQLLDLFGGVPMYDETTVVGEEFSNMLKARSSEEDTRKFILDDLEDAIAYLPEIWDEANKGRATQGAAYALKGKVLLFGKQYAEAEKCFEAISGTNAATYGYGLYPDYAGIFQPGGDESEEIVFAVQNIGGMGQDYGMPTAYYMGTRSTYGSGWNTSSMAADFITEYEYRSDGKRFDWDELYPGFSTDNDVKSEVFSSKLTSDNKSVESWTPHKDDLVNLWTQLDPRLQASVILPYTSYKGWTKDAPKDCIYVVADGTKAVNGFIEIAGATTITYFWRKFVPEYDMNGAINSRDDTPINFPLIRYADVLLMLAECYNETGNGDPIELINQVRGRVGMPALNSSQYLNAATKDEIFSRIEHERAVEFAGEGLRFSDLRRWGLYESKIDGMAKRSLLGTTFYKHSVETRDSLWPIPGDEIDKNPSLEQNFGWN